MALEADEGVADFGDAAELVGGVGEGGGTISVQVLNELAHFARRKMHLSWSETRAVLSTNRALMPAQPLTVEVHATGLELAERYGLSTYDAMIDASALHADCETLWSEDMQDGLALENRLRVANPCRGAG